MSNRTKVSVGVSMPIKLREKLDRTVRVSNLSRSQVICMAVEEFLSRSGTKFQPACVAPTTTAEETAS